VTRGSTIASTPGATRTAPAFRDDEMASAPWSLDRALFAAQCPTLLGRLRPSVVADLQRICSASALLAPARTSGESATTWGDAASTPPVGGNVRCERVEDSLPYPDGRQHRQELVTARGTTKTRSRLHGCLRISHGNTRE